MNKKQGFTLIELLIGISVSILIFLTTSSIFLLLYSADTRTRRTQVLEQTKNDIMQDMSNNVRWANDVKWSGGVLDLDSNVIYKLENQKLTRNGESLTAMEVLVTDFEVRDYSAESDYPSYEITIDFELASSSTQNDRLRMVVSKRKLQFLGNQSGAQPTPTVTTFFCPTPGPCTGNNCGGGVGPGR